MANTLRNTTCECGDVVRSISTKDYYHGIMSVEYLGESQLDDDCFIGKSFSGEIRDDWLKDCFEVVAYDED